jgi:predicted RecA/RadA family phage recombinase
MKNFVQPGHVISVIAPAAVASGKLVKVGLICGVAQHDAAEGASVEIALDGVFHLDTLSAQAWATVGLPIYMVPATGLATTATTSGNLFIGVNTETAVNPSGVGRVRLNGAAPTAVT